LPNSLVALVVSHGISPAPGWWPWAREYRVDDAITDADIGSCAPHSQFPSWQIIPGRADRRGLAARPGDAARGGV